MYKGIPAMILEACAKKVAMVKLIFSYFAAKLNERAYVAKNPNGISGNCHHQSASVNLLTNLVYPG